MSNSCYNQKWQECIADLLEQAEEENAPLQENRHQKGINYKRTDLEWFHFYAGLYIRYIDIYRKLEDCYSQLVHPQKRDLLKQMLDNTMVRMCEVKQNLVKYSTQGMVVQSDFVNLGEIVMNLKLTPKFLEVPMPRHFQEGEKKQVEKRNRLVKEYMEQHHGTTLPEEEEVVQNFVLDTSMDNAIRIIQRLQRGRQGILRGLESIKIRTKFLKEKTIQIAQINVDEQDIQRVTIVQKFWRAFSSRKLLSQLREDQIKFLGMRKNSANADSLITAQKQRMKLKLAQKAHENAYREDHDKIKQQVRATEEYTIKSAMLDERRKWIQKFLEMHEFCDVPKDAQEFYQKDNVDVDKENKENPKGKKEPKKDQKKGKKNELEKFLEEHDRNGPSQRVLNIQKTIEDHNSKWGGKDEAKNFEQKYDSQMARIEIRPSVQEEIQKKVDDMIALELDNMRIKYGLKKKKDKKKKKQKRKERKVKVPLGLNKRDPKQLLSELVQNKIVKILKPAKISELLGEYNPLVDERQYELMPDPSMAQLRQVVVENIAIPLGSQFAKDNLDKNNWFLFYGPMGTGKTLAVRSLQSQCNTILFDLTPSNVEQKYPDKASLKKLIWMVILLAKEFQPSIVMFDDFEQIFASTKKKKGVASSFGPKMKKAVVDMKKNKYWDKNDQIAVIGCSFKPYEASVKDYVKLFDKKFYFPYPDYATRKLIIETLIKEKMGKLPTYLNYNTIAHVTEGFTAGSFRQCVYKVLTEARIKRQPEDQLKVSEFVQPLSNTICTFAHEYEKFKTFTDEVTGLKERRESKLKPQTEDKRVKAKK